MPKLNKPGSFPKPKGIFKYGTKIFEHETENSRYTTGWVLASQYCKERFISRYLLKVFVKKRWVLCYKGAKTRICVKEICTDEINEYLGINPH